MAALNRTFSLITFIDMGSGLRRPSNKADKVLEMGSEGQSDCGEGYAA